MANHATSRIKRMAKGGAAKKVAIAVAAVLGVIVIYCALLVGSVLQVKRHATQAVSIVQSASAPIYHPPCLLWPIKWRSFNRRPRQPDLRRTALYGV